MIFLTDKEITAGLAVGNSGLTQLQTLFGDPVMAQQVHSTRVLWVDGREREAGEGDALLTRTPGVPLAVRTADCVPLLIYSLRSGIIGAIHAGWRGTLAGITTQAIRQMIDAGTPAESIHAIIGAYICRDCYEVSEELGTKFRAAGHGEYVSEEYAGGPHIDLGLVNRQQLISQGVKEGNIRRLDICTLCNTEYDLPSYRRDGTNERIYTYIIKEK